MCGSSRSFSILSCVNLLQLIEAIGVHFSKPAERGLVSFTVTVGLFHGQMSRHVKH